MRIPNLSQNNLRSSLLCFFFRVNPSPTSPVPTSSHFKYLHTSQGCRNSPFSSSGSSCFYCVRYPDRRLFNFPVFSGCSGVDVRFCSQLAASSENSGNERFVIDGFRPMATREQVSRIVELVIREEEDLESKLGSLNARFCVDSVTEVFRALNRKKVSGLCFFRWIRSWQPELVRNSDLCSLIIENCGRLEDFGAMRCLLDEFRLDKICLTKQAFGFLRFMIAREDMMRKRTLMVIVVLHEVGGSCYASGIHSLIEFFCGLGSLDMAKFVIENTGRNVSYYNILIKEMCQRCDFEAARGLLKEMRNKGCELVPQTYNYVISSLCKLDHADAWEVFQEMKDLNCSPDALTFEILICHCCGHGKFDVAFQLLDEMGVRGLEPRLSTHATIIKEFFRLQHYEEAYVYTVNAATKYKCSGNFGFSLLANLHKKKGNLVTAKIIISEMMEKGLRPEFKVYSRVLKRIQTSGRADLARELQEQFLQLELTT